jgi:hypothetical protein
MFGIKTKKDRKIEELNEKVEKLEESLYLTRFKQPRIYQQDRRTETVTAMRVLEDGVPTDVIKREITKMLVDEVYNLIDWDIEDYHGKKVIRGYLNYVVDEKRL